MCMFWVWWKGIGCIGWWWEDIDLSCMVDFVSLGGKVSGKILFWWVDGLFLGWIKW